MSTTWILAAVAFVVYPAIGGIVFGKLVRGLPPKPTGRHPHDPDDNWSARCRGDWWWGVNSDASSCCRVCWRHGVARWVAVFWPVAAVLYLPIRIGIAASNLETPSIPPASEVEREGVRR